MLLLVLRKESFMDLLENLIDLGVTRIDFDMELERTIFEIKYL